MAWLLLDIDNGWQMVFPDNDIKPHSKKVFNINGKQEAIVSDDMSCPCNPRIDFEHKIIIHNAFDGRE